MTAAMSPETRALIVRRLREEAARIKAGGEPRECVARGDTNLDLDTEGLTPSEARAAAETVLGAQREIASEGCWYDEVHHTCWGVVVPIEEARLVTRQCSYGQNVDADEVGDYDLVDAGAPETEPPLDPCEDDDCQTCHPLCEACRCALVLDDDGCCQKCGVER